MPTPHSSRAFLSVGQIGRRWGLSMKEIDAFANHYGWSTRKDQSTGWHEHYREDHVERTMEILHKRDAQKSHTP